MINVYGIKDELTIRIDRGYIGNYFLYDLYNFNFALYIRIIDRLDSIIGLEEDLLLFEIIPV